MLDNKYTLETKSLSDTVKAAELLREFTGIPAFEVTSDGGTQLTINSYIMPRLEKMFADFSQSPEVLENLADSLQILQDSDDNELMHIILPKIETHLSNLKEILPQLPAIRATNFQALNKKLNIFNKFIQSLSEKAAAFIKTQNILELRKTIEILSKNVQTAFHLVNEIFFFRGITLPQRDLAKEAIENLINILLQSDLLEDRNSEIQSIMSDYYLNIFSEFISMRKTNFLLNKYLKLPNNLEFSRLIFQYGSKIYLRILNHDEILSIGNLFLLEYRDIIDKMMPKGPEKQAELIDLHGLCFMQSMGNSDVLRQLFHYRFITNNKNIIYLSSRKNPEKWMETDKLLIGVSFGSLSMWKTLLKNNALSPVEIFSEINKFTHFLHKYIAKKIVQDRNVLLLPPRPATSQFIKQLKSYNSPFQSILGELQKFAQELKPVEKKTTPKIRKSQNPVQSYRTASARLDEKPLPILERSPAPLLAPPPPLPTLHRSPDECDADKRLKTKKYREARKKELKAQPLAKPQATTQEKIYEIISRLGHVIYGSLRLPPGTSPAIIETATRILEKGRLGLKNNQVKYVTNEEIKKMQLPSNSHYKLKGEILHGEEKGQLVRIYGVPDPISNLWGFSILVKKPHKTDGIELSKVVPVVPIVPTNS